MLADGLHAIGGPHLPAYLLIGETPVLFDAGMTFMGPAYRKDLQALLGDVGKLCCLYLTHAHFDHCGAGPYLKRNIPGLKIGAHRLAAETLRKTSAVELIRSLSRDCEELYRTERRGTSPSLPWTWTPLEDGARWTPAAAWAFRVIATPGHNPGFRLLLHPSAEGPHHRRGCRVFDRNFTIQPEFLAS